MKRRSDFRIFIFFNDICFVLDDEILLSIFHNVDERFVFASRYDCSLRDWAVAIATAFPCWLGNSFVLWNCRESKLVDI